MDVCVRAGLGQRLADILATLERDPYEPSQSFERLTNNLRGKCSRRIDRHNRIVYKVLQNVDGARDENGNLYEGVVRVLEAWGHRYKKSY
ncbi:hypothetical protein R80B4_01264 [Fibrobacteres bacterium R8-0-B4]